MIDRLSLRTRILLLFGLLGAGAIAITAGALWFAAQRAGAPEVTQAMVTAGLIAGFGIACLTALIWLLFDENVAKAVERLAAGIRVRAHTDAAVGLKDHGKYLGDLAPAAQSLTQQLDAERINAAQRIAAKTAELEGEKAQLAAVLSRIPLAVAVMSADHRITLYDAQCVDVLGPDAPLGLGRSAFDLFDAATLTQSFDELAQMTHPAPRRLDLPSADGQRVFAATMRRLSDATGYLLVLEVNDPVAAPSPLTFDFALLDGKARDCAGQTPLKDLTYVVFDTETTGLDPDRDAVVQIGALRIVAGKRVKREVFETYVNPGRPIPPAATQIHGVTDSDVATAPDMAEATRRFHSFADGAVLIAHNAPFDMRFLERATKHGAPAFENPILDTVLLSAATFGESETHTLDALCDRLGVTLPDQLRHTALGDARATAEAFLKLLPILADRGICSLEDAIAAMRQHQRLLRDMNAR